MGRKKSRKKKNRSGISASNEPFLKEWNKLCLMALNGRIDEEGRAVVAKKDAMMSALKYFNVKFSENLKKYNTNLGLLLETRSAITGSLVIKESGDEKENEYVPMKIIVQFGPVQNLDEHIATLKGTWPLEGTELEGKGRADELSSEQVDEQIDSVIPHQ